MSYHEFNLEERIAIRLGLLKKLSLRAIARQLKRSPSTISREVRRNSDADGNYTAYGAYQHTKARRVTCRPKRKLVPGSELFQMVKEMLRDHFSPQQIAGNLRRMFPKLKDAYVSHETIYNAIYALPVGELRKELIIVCVTAKPLAGRVQAVLTVATRSLTWSGFTCVRPKLKIVWYRVTGKVI